MALEEEIRKARKAALSSDIFLGFVLEMSGLKNYCRIYKLFEMFL